MLNLQNNQDSRVYALANNSININGIIEERKDDMSQTNAVTGRNQIG